MKTSLSFLCLMLLGSVPVIHAQQVQSLGEMDGFYRYTAVLGPVLEKGHRLRVMPQWMQETDFPYELRNPEGVEIPFADGLSVVRLLGGWGAAKLPKERRNDPNDLVYRDEEGALHYRWNLLKARLDPFISAGYTDLTLVLDNVPWCLAEPPIHGGFGQVGPPADHQEWYRFIRDLCLELKLIYGESIVNQFRFRMGTEMQGHQRFAGSKEAYLKYYDYAAKAVKDVIPQAAFGPFNRAMSMSAAEQSKINYPTIDVLDVVEHCNTGTNYATGEIGGPIDFLARSFYYFSNQSRTGQFNNIHPDQRMPEQASLWEQADLLSPEGGGLSREVHEFGPHLSTEHGLYGLDSGARGAAQTLHTLVKFKEIGVDRVWHWELFEKVIDDRSLLLSQGWLYSVMDHMRGGALYTLPVQGNSTDVNTQKTLLSVSDDRAILMIANWNVDREVDTMSQLRVQIPTDLLPFKPRSVKQLVFSEANSVYDVLRQDLKVAGLLSKVHLEHPGAPATLVFTAGYDEMASDRKLVTEYINSNWEKFEHIMRDSLILSPFLGTMNLGSNSLTLDVECACPSVTVLVLSAEL